MRRKPSNSGPFSSYRSRQPRAEAAAPGPTRAASLCKGLAHKLAVRTSGTYSQGHLIEVNAHSLFSKWFSESGKLVMSMFARAGSTSRQLGQLTARALGERHMRAPCPRVRMVSARAAYRFARIREILDDGDGFVCVLIDEVESLTAARQAAVAGSEPSDAVRVVNALLTQLDQLRRYKNALVLTTSNITGKCLKRNSPRAAAPPPFYGACLSTAPTGATSLSRLSAMALTYLRTYLLMAGAIDDAFLDRADIKQYIGPPSQAR